MKIYKQDPIQIIDNKSNRIIKHPSPALLDNIEILQKILNLIMDDWQNAKCLLANSEKAQSHDQLTDFIENYTKIQPHYLKCLFSYVLMFDALFKVYQKVFSSLNDINMRTNLRVKHMKKPKANPFIQKVFVIRNLSISHIGSTEKNSKLDSFAAHSWRPLSASFERDEAFDLENIEFGSGVLRLTDNHGKTSESLYINIKRLLNLHKECQNFIESYDNVCVNYLTDLKNKLPIQVGHIEYTI